MGDLCGKVSHRSGVVVLLVLDPGISQSTIWAADRTNWTASGCDLQHVGHREYLRRMVAGQIPEPGLEREPGEEDSDVDLCHRRGPRRFCREDAWSLERGGALEPGYRSPSGLVREPVHLGFRHVSTARRRLCRGPRHLRSSLANGLHLDVSRICAEMDERRLRAFVRGVRHRVSNGSFDHPYSRPELGNGGRGLGKSEIDDHGAALTEGGPKVGTLTRYLCSADVPVVDGGGVAR